MTPHKKKIITPLEALQAATIRGRERPRASAHAGVGGWFDWELIDRQGRAVQGGQFHNLFLNQGLDQFASVGLPTPGGGATPTPHTMVTHMSVGTGSAEPTVTDTALSAQLATSSTITANYNSRPSPGVYSLGRQWEFGFGAANGNLTEVAIRNGASGPIWARELFRDPLGAPITITKTSDFILRITYRWQITLSPTSLTPASFTIDGIGLINGNYMFIGGGASGAQSYLDLLAFSRVATGDVSGGAANMVPSASNHVPTGDYTDQTSNNGSYSATPTYSDYSPGDFTRTLEMAVWGTGISNGTIASIGALASTFRYGFAFTIDAGDRFVKDSDHILSINDLVTVTWGRA